MPAGNIGKAYVISIPILKYGAIKEYPKHLILFT